MESRDTVKRASRSHLICRNRSTRLIRLPNHRHRPRFHPLGGTHIHDTAMLKPLARFEDPLRQLPDIKPPKNARVLRKECRDGDDTVAARNSDQERRRAVAGQDGCRIVRRILDKGLSNPVEGELTDGLNGAFTISGGDGGGESLVIQAGDSGFLQNGNVGEIAVGVLVNGTLR